MGVPLDDLADLGTITLTTESPRQVWGRAALLSFFGILTILINLTFEMADAPWTPHRIGMAIAFDALMVIYSLALVLALSRGTWVIDSEGITFHPCHRRGRSLRWSAVERVRWMGYRAVFQGSGISITLPWHLLSADQREPARRYLKKLLAADFDLRLPERFIPMPLTRANAPRLVARGAVLSGYAVALTAIWVMGMIPLSWIAENHRGTPLARGLIAATAIGWMLTVFAGPWALAAWKGRAERRAWIKLRGWRPRLTKPTRPPVEDRFW